MTSENARANRAYYEGLARQVGGHAAGVVIARDPLDQTVPLRAEEGKLITQFVKDEVEEVGLLKMDFLGLRNLTMITKTLEITGVQGDPAHNAKVDGASLEPLLHDPQKPLGREAIYWHYPHYQAARPYGAVRSGPWRLIEFYEDMHVELYNLDDDIGETRDVSAEHPDVTARLRHKLHEWREDVGAQMPARVPGYTSTTTDR